MDIISNGQTSSLASFAATVSEFLIKDVSTYMDKLEDELLSMDDTIDITYTAGRNVKTKLRLHVHETDNI